MKMRMMANNRHLRPKPSGQSEPPINAPDDFSAWVLRTTMTRFTVGCKALLQEVPQFGDLVKVQTQDDLAIFGLIYDVSVQDDLAVRQLILVGDLEPEIVLDQQENRLVPIEIGVLIAGYRRSDQEIRHGLPSQPPASLDRLIVCDEAELRDFTTELDYLQLVLNTPRMMADELLIAHLVRAARVRPPEQRYPFVVGAGRQLARLLGADLVQLEYILKRLRPI
jgi:hypothetical protein